MVLDDERKDFLRGQIKYLLQGKFLDDRGINATEEDIKFLLAEKDNLVVDGLPLAEDRKNALEEKLNKHLDELASAKAPAAPAAPAASPVVDVASPSVPEKTMGQYAYDIASNPYVITAANAIYQGTGAAGMVDSGKAIVSSGKAIISLFSGGLSAAPAAPIKKSDSEALIDAFKKKYQVDYKNSDSLAGNDKAKQAALLLAQDLEVLEKGEQRKAEFLKSPVFLRNLVPEHAKLVTFDDLLSLDPTKDYAQQLTDKKITIVSDIIAAAHKINAGIQAELNLGWKDLDEHDIKRSQSVSSISSDSSNISISSQHRADIEEKHVRYLNTLEAGYKKEKEDFLNKQNPTIYKVGTWSPFSKKQIVAFDDAVVAGLRKELLSKPVITSEDIELALKQEAILGKEIFNYQDMLDKYQDKFDLEDQILSGKKEIHDAVKDAKASKEKHESNYIELDYRVKKAEYENLYNPQIVTEEAKEAEKALAAAKKIFVEDRAKNDVVKDTLKSFDNLVEEYKSYHDENPFTPDLQKEKAEKLGEKLNEINAFLSAAYEDEKLVPEDIEHSLEKKDLAKNSVAYRDLKAKLNQDIFKDDLDEIKEKRDLAKQITNLIDKVDEPRPIIDDKLSTSAMKIFRDHQDKLDIAERDRKKKVDDMEALTSEKLPAALEQAEKALNTASAGLLTVYQDDIKLAHQIRAMTNRVKAVGTGVGVVAKGAAGAIGSGVALTAGTALVGSTVILGTTGEFFTLGGAYVLGKATQGIYRNIISPFTDMVVYSGRTRALRFSAQDITERLATVEGEMKSGISSVTNSDKRSRLGADFENLKKTISNMSKDIKTQKEAIEAYEDQANKIIAELPNKKDVEESLKKFTIFYGKFFDADRDTGIDRHAKALGGLVNRYKGREAWDAGFEALPKKIGSTAIALYNALSSRSKENEYNVYKDNDTLYQVVKNSQGKAIPSEIPNGSSFQFRIDNSSLTLKIKTARGIENAPIDLDLLKRTIDPAIIEEKYNERIAEEFKQGILEQYNKTLTAPITIDKLKIVANDSNPEFVKFKSKYIQDHTKNKKSFIDEYCSQALKELQKAANKALAEDPFLVWKDDNNLANWIKECAKALDGEAYTMFNQLNDKTDFTSLEPEEKLFLSRIAAVKNTVPCKVVGGNWAAYLEENTRLFSAVDELANAARQQLRGESSRPEVRLVEDLKEILADKDLLGELRNDLTSVIKHVQGIIKTGNPEELEDLGRQREEIKKEIIEPYRTKGESMKVANGIRSIASKLGLTRVSPKIDLSSPSRASSSASSVSSSPSSVSSTLSKASISAADELGKLLLNQGVKSGSKSGATPAKTASTGQRILPQ